MMTRTVAASADVLAFFSRYRDAFDALDGERVARLYALPSGIAQAGTVTLWTTRAPLRDNMDALCALYRDRGYRRAAFEIGTYVAQGDRHAVADVDWRIDWHDPAQPPWRFAATYNLIREAGGGDRDREPDGGWRVLLCTAYEEDRLFAGGPAPAAGAPR